MQRSKTEILDVFFDESGKRKNKPNLMGALSVPRQLYLSESFQFLSQRLRECFEWEDTKVSFGDYLQLF